MTEKVVLVIAYDEPDEADMPPFVEMINRVQPLFHDKPGLMMHGAIRESAQEILALFARPDPPTMEPNGEMEDDVQADTTSTTDT